jgi:hypothetical protein
MYKNLNDAELKNKIGIDAIKWVEALKELHPNKVIDESLLHTWFANAIMAGYDRGYDDSNKFHKADLAFIAY